MRCNWCPKCEETAQDYYEEWWDENENGDNIPTPVPDNQLCMPFIFEEIGVKKIPPLPLTGSAQSIYFNWDIKKEKL